MSHERAIILSKQWAGVFAALFIALMVGSVSYAWTANAQIAVLQRDVNELTSANVSVRLAHMEEKLDWLVQAQRGLPYKASGHES